jgi:hypothetical protein
MIKFIIPVLVQLCLSSAEPLPSCITPKDETFLLQLDTKVQQGSDIAQTSTNARDTLKACVDDDAGLQAATKQDRYSCEIYETRKSKCDLQMGRFNSDVPRDYCCASCQDNHKCSSSAVTCGDGQHKVDDKDCGGGAASCTEQACCEAQQDSTRETATSDSSSESCSDEANAYNACLKKPPPDLRVDPDVGEEAITFEGMVSAYASKGQEKKPQEYVNLWKSLLAPVGDNSAAKRNCDSVLQKYYDCEWHLPFQVTFEPSTTRIKCVPLRYPAKCEDLLTASNGKNINVWEEHHSGSIDLCAKQLGGDVVGWDEPLIVKCSNLYDPAFGEAMKACVEMKQSRNEASKKELEQNDKECMADCEDQCMNCECPCDETCRDAYITNPAAMGCKYTENGKPCEPGELGSDFIGRYFDTGGSISDFTCVNNRNNAAEDKYKKYHKNICLDTDSRWTKRNLEWDIINGLLGINGPHCKGKVVCRDHCDDFLWQSSRKIQSEMEVYGHCARRTEFALYRD